MVNAYVFHLVLPHTLTTRYAGCVQGVCPGLNSCVAALGTRTSNRIDALLLVVSVFRGGQVDVFVPVMKVVLCRLLRQKCTARACFFYPWQFVICVRQPQPQRFLKYAVAETPRQFSWVSSDLDTMATNTSNVTASGVYRPLEVSQSKVAKLSDIYGFICAGVFSLTLLLQDRTRAPGGVGQLRQREAPHHQQPHRVEGRGGQLL